jgi:hypothetical protein
MKKIISFSLWISEKRNRELKGGLGDDKLYIYGAVMNAYLAKTIYPGWIVRFYCGTTVPEKLKEMLLALGAEIVNMEVPGDWTGMFWRFYPAGEEDVDVMISRDADSRLSVREATAVEEWLVSDKQFHTMRDNRAHNIPILGGMWGAKKGCIPNMKELMKIYVKGEFWQVDQNFLTEIISPRVRDKWMEHDPYYARKPFPTPRINNEFVGFGVDTDYDIIESLFPEVKNIIAN